METSNLFNLKSFYKLDKIGVSCWLFFLFSCSDAQEPKPAENLYFPPNSSSEWDEINYQSLDWDGVALAELLQWLPTQDTRAFIILKDGKLVVEEYWGDKLTGLGPMDHNSFWYWASAGKTLTAALIGIAQEKQILSINDRTQDYLGEGWSLLSNAQEREIKIHHHLSMTSGLDDEVEYPDQTVPEQLQFKAEAGTRWAYHNGSYNLLKKVLENASGKALQDFFEEELGSKIGMKGIWQKTGDNEVYYSDARSMARFGLLLLAEGKWGDQVIWNSSYFEEMKNSSQDLNESYGYLTWLNGKGSFMVPQSQQVLPGSLVSNAPVDMYQAMGKNGQFLMVIPSENLVVVRMGDAPGDLPVPFLLIRSIWDRMGPVIN